MTNDDHMNSGKLISIVSILSNVANYQATVFIVFFSTTRYWMKLTIDIELISVSTLPLTVEFCVQLRVSTDSVDFEKRYFIDRHQ